MLQSVAARCIVYLVEVEHAHFATRSQRELIFRRAQGDRFFARLFFAGSDWADTREDSDVALYA